MDIVLKTLSSNDLVCHVKSLIAAQKKYEIEILHGIAEIKRRRLYVNFGFANLADYCQEVFGLSEDVSWKRSRAAMAIGPYPKLLEMLKEGKTHISHIALVANRISQANQVEIYKFLPGKSQRGSCHPERSEGSPI